MKSSVFNGCLGVGVLFVGAGVYALAGFGAALVAVGALVIGLTLHVARYVPTEPR